MSFLKKKEKKPPVVVKITDDKVRELVDERIKKWWEETPHRRLSRYAHELLQTRKEKYKELEKTVSGLKAESVQRKRDTQDQIIEDYPCKHRGKMVDVVYTSYTTTPKSRAYDHLKGEIKCSFGPDGDRELPINNCIDCEFREEPEEEEEVFLPEGVIGLKFSCMINKDKVWTEQLQESERLVINPEGNFDIHLPIGSWHRSIVCPCCESPTHVRYEGIVSGNLV